jgi:hypothetical protein
MKVSQAMAIQKVCCPHCRQNVVLEPEAQTAKTFPVVLENDLTVQTAATHLEDILTRCKEKRRALVEMQEEIVELEARARSLGHWLQTQQMSPEDLRSTRVLIDLQSRLFEQVQGLQKGYVVIVDCAPPQEKSLAQSIRLTFEAFGWSVRFERGERAAHCGEEVTFVVAPGPVSYAASTIYMALQSAGIRLHSQIDLEQPEEIAVLCVHCVSHIPKLLPAPKHAVAQKSPEPLRQIA